MKELPFSIAPSVVQTFEAVARSCALPMTSLLYAAICLAAWSSLPSLATANDFEPQIREAFEHRLTPWLENPVVIEAIEKQNREHKTLSATDIDAMDKDWHRQAKAGGGPLIERLLTKETSVLLAKRKESSDELSPKFSSRTNKGLNVAQSDIASDDLRGDEAKWQKTYAKGGSEVFIDDIEFDDSTETFQSQVSTTITDPSTGELIGAVTFGINIEML